jgi:hypothetical protein
MGDEQELVVRDAAEDADVVLVQVGDPAVLDAVEGDEGVGVGDVDDIAGKSGVGLRHQGLQIDPPQGHRYRPRGHVGGADLHRDAQAQAAFDQATRVVGQAPADGMKIDRPVEGAAQRIGVECHQTVTTTLL